MGYACQDRWLPPPVPSQHLGQLTLPHVQLPVLRQAHPLPQPQVSVAHVEQVQPLVSLSVIMAQFLR